MTSSIYMLRYKELVHESVGVVILALLLIAVGAVGVAVTDIGTGPIEYSPMVDDDDPVEDVPEKTHTMDMASSVATTVTNDTRAYTSGQRLRDVGVYPINGTTPLRVTIASSGTNSRVVQQTVQLQYEATIQGVEQPFWTDSQVIVAGRYGEPGFESYNKTGEINAVNVSQRVTSLEEDFGSAVDVTVYIEATAQFRYRNYDTARDGGEAVAARQTVETQKEVLFSESLIAVPSASDSQSTTTGDFTRPSDRIDNGIVNMVLLVVAAGSVGGCVVSVGVWWRGDADRVQHVLEQRENKEWITAVDRVGNEDYESVSRVDGLTELVDLALDMRTRAMYSRADNEFSVISNDVKYVYTPTVEPHPSDVFTPSTVGGDSDVLASSATTQQRDEIDDLNDDGDDDSSGDENGVDSLDETVRDGRDNSGVDGSTEGGKRNSDGDGRSNNNERDCRGSDDECEGEADDGDVSVPSFTEFVSDVEEQGANINESDGDGS